MKIVFEKHVHGNFFGVLPRALFASDEEKAQVGGIPVALSRSGSSCVFPLYALEAHDGHAPGWVVQGEDGVTPEGRSMPGMLASQYMQRIVDAVKAAGANVESVDVNVTVHENEVFEPEGAESKQPPVKKEDWKPYLGENEEPEGEGEVN